MATKQHLDGKREARHRLGLLALANQRPETNGSCLAPAELAALVEGRMNPEEREASLVHLADCEECYGQWLQLDRFWREQSGQHQPGRRFRLLAPRSWAAVGSLLAAAASLAVFFSLTERAGWQTIFQLQEKPVQEDTRPAPAATTGNIIPKQAEPAQPSLELAPSEQTLNKPAVPMGQPEQDQGMLNKSKMQPEPKRAPQTPRNPAKALTMEEERQKVPADTEQSGSSQEGKAVFDTRAAHKKEQAASGKSDALSAPGREQTQRHPAAPAATGRLLPLVAWHQQIHRGCAAAPSPEFFTAMTQQGQLLLAQTAHLTASDRQHIQEVLAQLKRPLPPSQQCQVLLRMLPSAQERNQRP